MVRCLPAGRPEDSGISLQIIQVSLQASCSDVVAAHNTHLAELGTITRTFTWMYQAAVCCWCASTLEEQRESSNSGACGPPNRRWGRTCR